jgi:predicted membrane channel-forming protein YqfA (hemolysin III family)
LAEPTTVLTDYALAALAVLLAERLLRSASPLPGARRLWVAAFLLSALGAFLGGTRHALSPSAVVPREHLWTLTYLVLGLANFALLAGCVRAVLPRPRHAAAYALLGLRFVVYAVWLLRVRQVRLVVADFALSLLLLLAFAFYYLFTRRGGTGGWLLAGILVSAAGAAIQASGLPPFLGLNHNDWFHVVQMGGTWLFYRAGLRLEDR